MLKPYDGLVLDAGLGKEKVGEEAQPDNTILAHTSQHSSLVDIMA
ncbi:hypothetical protein [Methylovorus sp. MM2]|nr:hypothetical protein [Methylovorus sp. MM2]